jgi:hypothetical protein
MNEVVLDDAAAVNATCSIKSSSQFIGFAAAHCFFELDQSKSTIVQPTVDVGSTKPLSLHVIMIVLRFNCQD